MKTMNLKREEIVAIAKAVAEILATQVSNAKSTTKVANEVSKKASKSSTTTKPVTTRKSGKKATTKTTKNAKVANVVSKKPSRKAVKHTHIIPVKVFLNPTDTGNYCVGLLGRVLTRGKLEITANGKTFSYKYENPRTNAIDTADFKTKFCEFVNSDKAIRKADRWEVTRK